MTVKKGDIVEIVKSHGEKPERIGAFAVIHSALCIASPYAVLIRSVIYPDNPTVIHDVAWYFPVECVKVIGNLDERL